MVGLISSKSWNLVLFPFAVSLSTTRSSICRRAGASFPMAPLEKLAITLSLHSFALEGPFHFPLPLMIHRSYRLSFLRERVLINRGWVPLKMKEASARAEGQIQGEVEVRGLLRPGDAQKARVHENGYGYDLDSP